MQIEKMPLETLILFRDVLSELQSSDINLLKKLHDEIKLCCVKPVFDDYTMEHCVHIMVKSTDCHPNLKIEKVKIFKLKLKRTYETECTSITEYDRIFTHHFYIFGEKDKAIYKPFDNSNNPFFKDCIQNISYELIKPDAVKRPIDYVDKNIPFFIKNDYCEGLCDSRKERDNYLILRHTDRKYIYHIPQQE
jgi:hypothetical protein